ncbi:hypothetical protein K9U33_10260 [Rhodoblastus acidophilus]|uniref:RHS repeat protein n=1 Tax=Candidatus Rhodoblastus alkanivorans TaxID=2954117 RepID=A0ABS9Z224_9HYPH|nr:RHS repeat-associated core domain-containing protein [Candidatus Rhodoblastus alkanivorans]MCI4679030.1 hypothetical protein [Candidatus Rhodoblastus alkanivorans]MCI4681715.1 hypothetical protein [Candidatus Rhodoblastus alkanivorans]
MPTTVQLVCQNGYTRINNQCVLSNEVVPPSPSCKVNNGAPAPIVGDPISVMDGAQMESAEDYATADGLFAIRRTYRSARTLSAIINYDVPAGWVGGWAFDFLPELHLGTGNSAGTLSLRMPDGTAYNFSQPASGNVLVPQQNVAPQTRYSVAYNGSTSSSWSTQSTTPTQWTVVDAKTKETWVFQTFQSQATGTSYSAIGRPISKTLPDGYTQTYTYDSSGTLQSIADSRNRSFSFTWTYFAFLSGGGAYGEPIIYTNVPVAIKSIGLPDGTTLNYAYGTSLNSNGTFTTPYVRTIQSVTRTNASGVTLENTSYLYENTGFPDFLTGIVDARGVRTLTVTYDDVGRAISASGADGQNNYSVAYTPAGSSNPNVLTRTVTNPLGKQTVYNFSHPLNGYNTTLQSVNGQASANCVASNSSYTYDANGFVASVTDEEGRVTTYVNDAQGRPTSVTRGAGSAQAVTTSYTWDPVFNIPTSIVAPGRTTTQTVVNGLVTSITQTDTTTQSVPYSTNGQTRTWAYNFAGSLLTSVTDPTGAVVHYAYDSNGYLHSVTNEMGLVTTINSVNSLGQPTQITDPNGIVTTLAYDYRGRLTNVSVDTANSPATTTIAYDAVGDVASTTDPNGATTTYTYDSDRRLTKVANAAGETITYARDAMGDATSVTYADASSVTTYSKTAVFDELGRIIKWLGATPSNSTYSYGYDRTNNLLSITDPRSNVFSNGYDALNRLISQTNEENATVNLTRNGLDAITGYQDARALTTVFARNGFGEIIGEQSPDRGTTIYYRDSRGRVTQKIDPRGIVSNMQYDAQGRLTYESYPSNPSWWRGFTWDVQNNGANVGLGNLVGVNDEAALNWRVFDGKGRIVVDWRTNNPAPALAVGYTYDLAGNITSMTYPSGRIVAYVRDTLGRISAISTQQNSAAAAQAVIGNATYEPFGPLAGFYHGNGLQTVFTYDTDYRVTRVQVGPPSNLGATLDRSLSWTGDDIINSIIDNQFPGTTPGNYNSQTQTFTYTPARRLASANGYYGALSWTYDANGDRLSETANSVLSSYLYNLGSNQLGSVASSSSTRSFTYDAAGNMLTDSRAGALGMTFQYDVRGRLAKAFQTSAPANAGAYAYDADGRLASRTVTQGTTTTTTLYVYDLSGHVIAETDTSGNTLREYIWMGDLPVAVVAGINTSTPTIYYVHTDHLGRPARMTAQNWAWVWDVIYSPFGATSYIWTNPATMDLRFPGQWFQLESGLAYNWHRHYDATIGRYVEPDPLGLTALLSDGPSVNNYVGGNPLARVDEDGQQAAVISLACAENPTCAAAFAVAAAAAAKGGAKICAKLLDWTHSNNSDCNDDYRQSLQNQVNALCKPLPPRCRSSDSCASMKQRIAAFTACGDARKKINDACYKGGDNGHQQAYTTARQEAAICEGMLATCTTP